MGFVPHIPDWQYASYRQAAAPIVLDMKQGDVNGDGVPDLVYLIGNKPDGPTGIFADQITLAIQDGSTQKISRVHLQNNSGYNAQLFLGDVNKDRVADIWISIETGGSGGYGIFYIYSFRNNDLNELFNVQQYNEQHQFKVNYEDLYKVGVGSPQLDVLFTLDISYRGYDYLSQYYNEQGKLKQPVEGEVLSMGALYPIVTDLKSMSYDLLAFQRIIGTSNADTLGYVENLLSWGGTAFISSRLSASIPGTKLIALY
ncbi:Repeat domain-containing protein [Paenibacillus sp. 1_12]|uniref:spore coat protein n=1 Tax=Paenibacillus sp. 1_12 TaxID=1566278 RepID=UPI0008E83610|nr:spore coat protein [Paenibacillus sp. 1_12]SFL98463.1 Repeat domain-containing protein [Paenibacillus sp. 1_12]